MKNLELVISADTAIAHLAGALGVPVWLAIPPFVEWRWLVDRADSPWYPTMRLFRQKERGRWQELFIDMAEALRKTCA
jgi:ADP-heptose:LPS heptosyltransferase